MTIRTLFLLLTLLTLARLANAQPYETRMPALTPAVWSTLALGDVDGDGDLDVLLTGIEALQGRSLRVYRNEGRNAAGHLLFADAPTVLPGIEPFLVRSILVPARPPSMRWGDFDGDGDLDLLVASSESVAIYQQETPFVFTPVYTDTPLLTSRDSTLIIGGLNTPYASWGDYDRDGDLDALVARRSGTRVLRNDDGLFMELSVGLPILANPTVSWDDFDGDGDLDVLAVQRLHGGRSTTTIFSLTDGRYEALPLVLPGVEQGTASWADYDGDGDLDVLVTGGPINSAPPVGAETPAETYLFRNDAGTLVRLQAPLPGAWYGQWLDADADGDLDLLLLSGDASNNTTFRIIRNDAGRFLTTSAVLPGVWLGAAAAGDLDVDGRPDLLLTGYVRAGQTQARGTLLHTNVDTSRTRSSVVPGPLRANHHRGTLSLDWNAPPDSLLASGLTFNVRVGTTPGAGDVVAAHALPDGRRLLSAPGNAGRRRSLAVRGLDSTATYYWSVQAVDAARVGHAFAAEHTVVPDTARVTTPRPRRLPDIIDNFPNPFNPTTTIRFALDVPSDVRVVVYDVLGAEVGVVAQGRYEKGMHEAVWDGRDRAGRAVPSGVYLCVLDAAGQRTTHSMLLLK